MREHCIGAAEHSAMRGLAIRSAGPSSLASQQQRDPGTAISCLFAAHTQPRLQAIRSGGVALQHRVQAGPPWVTASSHDWLRGSWVVLQAHARAASPQLPMQALSMLWQHLGFTVGTSCCAGGPGLCMTATTCTPLNTLCMAAWHGHRGACKAPASTPDGLARMPDL